MSAANGRKPRQSKDPSGRSAADYEVDRLTLQRTLLLRVGDMARSDPIRTATGLLDLAIALIAKEYPGELSKKDKSRVKQNSRSVTTKRMRERAMSRDGVRLALGFAELMGTIAIDYFAPTNCNDELNADASLLYQRGPEVMDRVVGAFVDACDDGLTPFGAASMLIHAALNEALAKGVEPLLLARPLCEALGRLSSEEEVITLSREVIIEQHVEDAAKRFGLSKEKTRQLLGAVQGPDSFAQ